MIPVILVKHIAGLPSAQFHDLTFRDTGPRKSRAHPDSILACEDANIGDLVDVLDQIVEECAWVIDLEVWATDNEFPDFGTDLEYAR